MTQQMLTPYLCVDDARAAIAFYQTVFGAEVVDGEYFEMDDGRIGHASLRIGEAVFFLSEEFPELEVVAPRTIGGTTMAIVINVADADVTFELAVSEGATPQREPEDQHGGRSGWIKDPWGHRWSPTGPARG